MSHGHRDVLSARVILTMRSFFVLLGLTSMVLGYIGLSRYMGPEIASGARPVGDNSASNIIYYDIELFLV
jgi:hypothetical protein